MRGPALFAQQLRDAGVSVEEPHGDRVVFAYSAVGGGYALPALRVGVVVSETFPDEPPGGVHVHPRHRADNGGAQHPQRVAGSVFGADWEYWSRPFPGWAHQPAKNARTYLRWVDHLLETTP